MPPTFEEIADSGLKDNLPDKETAKGRAPRFKLLFILLLCIGLGGLAYWKITQPVVAPEPVAAKILLSDEDEIQGVLPHSKDSATEFKASLDYLKEDAVAPDYRETEAAKVLVATTIEAEDEAETITETISVPIRIDPPSTTQLPAEQLNATLETSAVSVPEVATPTSHQENKANSDLNKSELSVNPVIDWGGMVLVPKDHVLAKAYNSSIRIVRIEAHPIDGDYIRVWTRVQNKTDRTIIASVGCEFRGTNNQVERPRFKKIELPPHAAADTYFVSKQSEIRAYTVLVKR